jgi:HlyD family secretion protein
MRQVLKKRTFWIILVLLVVGVAAFFVVRSRNATAAESQFQTATIERGNLTATIGATGTVRAKQSAVLVWQAAGTVEETHVKVGDAVQADDVLASLVRTSLPQSVILAEADLATAQQELDELLSSNTAEAEAVITLRDAQEAFTKAENWNKQVNNGKIHMERIIWRTVGTQQIPVLKQFRAYADEETKKKAQEDLDLAQARLDDAQRTYDQLKNGNTAEIIAAQARVEAAQATINLARVLAPFNATVTEAHPLPGDQVAAGATAFRLDDLTSLYVDVDVSEVDINSIKVDQPVTLTFDAILDKEYHGEVVEVAQTGVDTNGVVNFKVTVELTDADSSVRPGMTAAVNIVVEEMNDVILVPNRAVRLVDNERVVYLLVDGQSVKKEIRLGSSSDTMSVVAVGDIKEGDLIILNPPSAQFGPGGGPRGDFD